MSRFEQTESAASEVRAFVSYTHDSIEHKQAVLSMALHLREFGVLSWLDQFDEVPPPKSWPAWMYDQIDQAKFVLAVCSATYRRRVEGRENSGVGLGATWEGAILTQLLYEQMDRPFAWVIPVLIDGCREESIPYFLRGTTYYRIEVESPASYGRLLEHLLDRPSVRPNPVGRPPADLANLEFQPKSSKRAPDSPPNGSQTTRYIPEVSLLDLLGESSLRPRELARRWAEGRSASPPLVIGQGEEGVVLWDPVTEGPNALVAGTTGSGKSELLRTILASTALTYSPDVWTFLLIDYKGGRAFGELVELPHTIGLITDLDVNGVARLAAVLESELRRREKLLWSWGFKSISDVWEQPETERTLPRLLIVVDEFASLVHEQPEFMEQLVRVAQRGRSLGIHLMLATQRPAGAVSAAIRANVNMRFALRVVDAADSVDVLGVPDASTLSRDPGMGYMRAAHFDLILFRAALSRSLQGQNPWGLKDVVAATVEAATLSGLLHPGQGDWLRGLPETLPLASINPGGASTEPAVGLIDDTSGLTLRPLRLRDGRFGHLRVIGTKGSGKTTALMSITKAYSEAALPGELEVFIIQGQRRQLEPASGLPHTILALRNEAYTEALDLLRLVASEIDRRLSVRPWKGSTPSLSDSTLLRTGPRVLLVVDDAHLLVDIVPEAAALIQRISTAPEEVAVDLIVSTDFSAAVGPLAAVEGRELLMRLTNEGDYVQLGGPVRVLPERLPPGRGYLLPDGYWVQVAL